MRKIFRLPTRPLRSSWIWVVLFVAALLPRLVALGRYITADELIWVYRSVLFREALLAREWPATLVAGHPGVTTTWLGAVGISLQMLFVPGSAATYEWITKLAWLTPDNMAAFQQLATFLSATRLMVIVVNCIGIVLIYLLTRQLWGPVVALLSSLFLAFDPFFAGLSGLLHVDGLATTFVTVSLLTLLVTVGETQRRRDAEERRRMVNGGRGVHRWLTVNGKVETRPNIHNSQFTIHNSQFILSAVSAALAVLTKSPALLLLPLVAAVFAWMMWQRYQAGWQDWFSRTIVQGLLWLASLGVTLLVLFPALWSAPLSVWQLLTSSAGRHIDEALRPTFFLGQVAYDHGPLFYPVALLWRLSPVVFTGLILLILASFRRRVQWSTTPIVVLLLWAAIFLAAITPAAKKFDRYMLPAIPALILLGVLGWVIWTQSSKGRWLLTAALLGQMAYWLLFWPYPLTAYNLLVGGPLTAARVMPLGWGESISTGGSWLADWQPHAELRAAVSGIAPSLAPFFPGQTLLAEVGGREQADYVIYTAGSKQESTPGLIAETAGLELLHTIRYGGLEQAWIYRQSDPQRPDRTLSELVMPVVFDGRMALPAVGTDLASEQFTVLARWQRLQSGGHLLLKLELRDEQGNRWSGLETALLNEVYFYPEEWAENERPEVMYRLERPPAMPPADYTLVLTLFDEDSGGQLAVLGVDGGFVGVEYRVGSITVPLEETPVPVERLDIPQAADASWFDGALVLLGHSAVPQAILGGEELLLDVFWQGMTALPMGVELEWTLQIVNCELPIVNCEVGGAEEQGSRGEMVNGQRSMVNGQLRGVKEQSGTSESPNLSLSTLHSPLSTLHSWVMPLSRYDTELWRVGETVHEKVRLLVPAELAAGEYVLRVAPVGADSSWEVGRVEVVAADRLFQLPEDVGIPLAYEFGDGIHLYGSKLLAGEVSPGRTADFTLYWQTDGRPEAIYTAFVHLLDEAENIVAQADHWPGGLPSHTWVAGQVIVDQFLLPIGIDVPPGQYRVVLGLYTAEDGVRLPVDDGAADRVILPQLLNVVADE